MTPDGIATTPQETAERSTRAMWGADAASRMAQEGKTGAATLKDREKEFALLKQRQEKTAGALETLVADIATEEERWGVRAGELRKALDTHGDVESMIAEQESLRENHRSSHEDFLARQDAARSIGLREEALRAADEALRDDNAAVEEQEREVGRLSGGQRRLLAISRAIEANPKIFLLDEPTHGLSKRVIKEIFDLLKRTKEEKDTSIIITSQWYEQISHFIDDVIVLRTGEIAGQFDAEFLGLYPH